MNLDLDYQKNWNTSLGRSIALHVLLLLLAFLFRLQSDPNKDIDTQYAVTVSFEEVEFRNTKSSNSTKSRSSEGAQRAKSESPKKIEAPKPTEVKVPTPAKTQPKPVPTPTPPVEAQEPTPPVISETTTEESEIEAVEEPIEVEDPEPEYIPEPTPDPIPADEPVIINNPELPSLDDIIGDINDDPIEMEEENVPAEETGSGDESSSTSGSGDSDPSLKDGDGGSGKGDTGDGRGSDADGDDGDSGRGTGDHGEGEYDASGHGIFGRQPIYNDKTMPNSKSGKLVFKICINRRGIVTYVEINELETTIKDYDVLRQGLESMRKYKFEVDLSAPKEQCGKYSYVIDNFKGFSG